MCFKHAENACAFLLGHGIGENDDDPVYYPLVAAIYVLYARPFTRANLVGRLTEYFVPEEFRELHAVMLDHRDQVYAHADPRTFYVPGMGAPNQVRVRLTTEGSSKKCRLLGSHFFPRPPTLAKIAELCRALQELADAAVVVLQERNFFKLLSKEDGDYPLNVFDKDGPFFLPKASEPFDEIASG